MKTLSLLIVSLLGLLLAGCATTTPQPAPAPTQQEVKTEPTFKTIESNDPLKCKEEDGIWLCEVVFTEGTTGKVNRRNTFPGSEIDTNEIK